MRPFSKRLAQQTAVQHCAPASALLVSSLTNPAPAVQVGAVEHAMRNHQRKGAPDLCRIAMRFLPRAGRRARKGFLRLASERPSFLDGAREITRSDEFSRIAGLVEKHRLAASAQLIELRSAQDFSAGHLEGATNIPLEELEARR